MVRHIEKKADEAPILSINHLPEPSSHEIIAEKIKFSLVSVVNLPAMRDVTNVC